MSWAYRNVTLDSQQNKKRPVRSRHAEFEGFLHDDSFRIKVDRLKDLDKRTIN